MISTGEMMLTIVVRKVRKKVEIITDIGLWSTERLSPGGRGIYTPYSVPWPSLRPEEEEIKEKITIFQGVGLVVSRGHGIKGYHKGKEIMKIEVSMVPMVTN